MLSAPNLRPDDRWHRTMTDHQNEDLGRRRLFTAALPPFLAVASLWIAFAFDRVYHIDLYRHGVRPRSLQGLWGIITSPFVHADMDHLLGNSTAMLVLGWLLVYFYPKASWRVVLASWLLGGLWVWSTARDSYHIGASGIIYGMAAFLFFSGLIRRRVALMAVSLIVVFLYGSMVWGVLPLMKGVSWESHLFGALAGAMMAWFYRRTPPAHVPPPIVLEDDEEIPEEEQALSEAPQDVLPGNMSSTRSSGDARPIRFVQPPESASAQGQ
jgi:membrane associated rhomboid family serine protease